MTNLRLIRNLEKRISQLSASEINKTRRPIYRYHHKGYDIVENEAWRWFADMQLTPLELQEFRGLSKRREELGYASIVQPNPPEKVKQDRNLYDRQVALSEIAELRAEQILEQEPQQWYDWFRYFQAHVWTEMNSPIDIEVHEDEEVDSLLDFELRYMAAYKARDDQLNEVSKKE